LLIYPATDQNLETDSLRRNGEGYLLTRALMEKFRSYYLPRAADYADWRASPALAKSHADLPPAFVLTAGFDPLLDEGRQYVELLARAGVEVAYRDYPDMVHGFIVMGGVLDTANAAVADCCAALRRAFDKVLA
jgi:acetyl esterase